MNLLNPLFIISVLLLLALFVAALTHVLKGESEKHLIRGKRTTLFIFNLFSMGVLYSSCFLMGQQMDRHGPKLIILVIVSSFLSGVGFYMTARISAIRPRRARKIAYLAALVAIIAIMSPSLWRWFHH